MAYIDQARKAQLLPAIKAVLAKHGIKATVGIHNNSTLVVRITSGRLDLIGNYNATMAPRMAGQPEHMRHVAKDDMDINPYWAHEHFTGECLEFVTALLAAMNTGNHDKSDIMTDYFDVGWYRSVKVGDWCKPYQLTAGVVS